MWAMSTASSRAQWRMYRKLHKGHGNRDCRSESRARRGVIDPVVDLIVGLEHNDFVVAVHLAVEVLGVMPMAPVGSVSFHFDIAVKRRRRSRELMQWQQQGLGAH